jgi:hypothetical protein
MALDSLITAADSFEVVRDQIAAVLVDEVANQKALATAAAEDPNLWDLSVFLERHFPFEQWLDAGVGFVPPIVNIWLESALYDGAISSQIGGRQIYDATYNIDVFGRGFATNDPGGGHTQADLAAHLECHRAVKLVRNILTARQNRLLQLPQGFINPNPKFENFQYQQPAATELPDNIAIWACRTRFAVRLNETAQALETYGTLDTIHITTSQSGQVILETEIDTT